jgi:hypothetical protein
LKELFAPGRNDPCPCGSGLKYKRCCQGAVQEYRAALRDGAGPEAAAAMPRLLDAVALACGLKPAGGDALPAVEEAVAALRGCYTELANPEKEPDYEEILNRLVAVLRRRRELRLLRFSPARLAALAEEGEARGLRLVRQLVTPEFPAEASVAFARSFRAAAGDADALLAAATALYCLLEARDTDVVGSAVLRATVEDLEEARARLSAVRAEAAPAREGGDLFGEVWEKYPFLVEEVARRYWAEARVALRALGEGRLTLDIPLYALLAGIAAVRGELAVACARAVPDGKRLAQNLQAVVVGLFDPAGVLAEAAAGDFPFFEAAAQRELAAAAEAATDGDLRRAIEALRDGLDLADAPGFAVVYHLFYVGVLLQMLAEGNIRVPRRGGPPVPVSVFSLRSEHLADYAAYLEEQGERAAAARVREVAPLFDKDASDADPSDW